MRMRCAAVVRALCLALLGTGGLARPAAANPFRYETTWTDAAGVAHTLRFRGDVTRGAVTGEARLDGHAFGVRGTVHTDGTLSATVGDASGRTLATVEAAPDGDGGLAGTVTRTGTEQPVAWRLPRVVLPEATAP